MVHKYTFAKDMIYLGPNVWIGYLLSVKCLIGPDVGRCIDSALIKLPCRVLVEERESNQKVLTITLIKPGTCTLSLRQLHLSRPCDKVKLNTSGNIIAETICSNNHHIMITTEHLCEC